MWELNCEESWVLKNWCFWTVVLEKTPESPLDCKEIQQVHSEGDQSWVFFGGNDAKDEAPVLWPPHAKSWLIGKDSDAGRDWGQEEKGMTEDEMALWHHGLNGREIEWTPGDGDGQGGLACCDSWGHKESDTTEQLNWTELRSLFLNIFLRAKHVCVLCAQLLQSCLTFCDPMHYSLPGSSVHESLWARILAWVAISFSKGASWVGDRSYISCISCTAGRFFTPEPPRKPHEV